MSYIGYNWVWLFSHLNFGQIPLSSVNEDLQCALSGKRRVIALNKKDLANPNIMRVGCGCSLSLIWAIWCLAFTSVIPWRTVKCKVFYACNCELLFFIWEKKSTFAWINMVVWFFSCMLMNVAPGGDLKELVRAPFFLRYTCPLLTYEVGLVGLFPAEEVEVLARKW